MSKKRKHRWDEVETYPEYFLYYNPQVYRQENTTYENSGMGIRWIFVLVLLLVIVLQFGRRQNRNINRGCMGCECQYCTQSCGINCNSQNTEDCQLIDNNVLFIVVTFLLVLCNGCWFGGFSRR